MFCNHPIIMPEVSPETAQVRTGPRAGPLDIAGGNAKFKVAYITSVDESPFDHVQGRLVAAVATRRPESTERKRASHGRLALRLPPLRQ
jgi:hypothetical protein